MRLIAATGASAQLGFTAPNPVDPEAADGAFRAAISLAAALPYRPAPEIEAPVFRHLAL